MELNSRFAVRASPDEVFSALLDVERVASCLPGLEFQGRDGDDYRGAVAVKVGPVLARYAGAARVVEVDEAARTAAVTASVREVRGQGGAEARMDLAVERNGQGSLVELRTALDISGRAAQFGRGVLNTVAERLVQQFAANLEALLAAPAAPTAGEQPGPAAPEAPAAPAPLDALALLPPPFRQALPLLAAAVLGFLLGRLSARPSLRDLRSLGVVAPATALHERNVP